MLQSVLSLTGFEAHATDGQIGTAFDFFFDDETWFIRYFVVDTGTWLTSRKILLAIESVGTVDMEATTIHVSHSKRLIQDSPIIDLARPATREEEIMVRRHYGLWPHWAPYLMGAGPHKLSSLRDKAGQDLDEREHIPTHALFSLREIHAFQLSFPGEVIETVSDLLIAPDTWEIKQFVFHQGVAGTGKAYCVGREHLTAYDRESKILSLDLPLEDATPVEELVSVT